MMVPNPSLLASVINVNVLLKSGNFSTGASQSFCFNVSKASCCLSVQWNDTSFLIRSLSGFAILLKFFTNFR